MSDSLEQRLGRHQFFLADTGGGFEALLRFYPDGSAELVTLAEDPNAPTELGDQVIVGSYLDGLGGELYSAITGYTLAECLAALDNDSQVPETLTARLSKELHR